MIKVSAGTLTKYRSIAEKALNRLKGAREKGEQMMGTATRTAVVSGTAFGLGVIEGKTGGMELVGVPLALIVGAGAHVAGFAKMGGRHSDQLHNVGDGALALYAGRMGTAIGINWKQTGKLGMPARVAGELPEGFSGADSLTDEELAASVLRR